MKSEFVTMLMKQRIETFVFITSAFLPSFYIFAGKMMYA